MKPKNLKIRTADNYEDGNEADIFFYFAKWLWIALSVILYLLCAFEVIVKIEYGARFEVYPLLAIGSIMGAFMVTGVLVCLFGPFVPERYVFKRVPDNPHRERCRVLFRTFERDHLDANQVQTLRLIEEYNRTKPGAVEKMARKNEISDNIGMGFCMLFLPFLLWVVLGVGGEPVSIPRVIVYGSIILGVIGGLIFICGIGNLLVKNYTKSKAFSICCTGIALILLPVILWSMTQDISFGELGAQLIKGFKKNWFAACGFALVAYANFKKVQKMDDES